MNNNTLFTSAEIVWIDDSFAHHKYNNGYNFWQDMFNVPDRIYRLFNLKISMFSDHDSAINFINTIKDNTSTYYYFIVDLNLPKNKALLEDPKPKFGKSIGMRLAEENYDFTFLSSASNLGSLKGEEYVLKTKGDFYIKKEHSDLKLPLPLKNKLLSNIKKNIKWIDIYDKLNKPTTSEFFFETSNAFKKFPYFDKYAEFVNMSEFNSLPLHNTLFIKSHYNNNEYFEKQSILIMLADTIINSYSDQYIHYYHLNSQEQHKINEFNAWVSKKRNNDDILVIKLSNISIKTFLEISNDLSSEKVIFILRSDEYEVYIEAYNDSYSLYEIPSFETNDSIQKKILVDNILHLLLDHQKDIHPIYKENPELLFDPTTYTALINPVHEIAWLSDSYELFKEIEELIKGNKSIFITMEPVQTSAQLSIDKIVTEPSYDAIVQESVYFWLKNSWNFPYGIQLDRIYDLTEDISIQWEMSSVKTLSALLQKINFKKDVNQAIENIQRIIHDENIKHIVFDKKLQLASKDIVSSFKWPHKEFPIPSIIHKKFEEINKHLWFQHNKFNYINYSNEISMQYSGLENEIEYYDKTINLIENTYTEFPKTVQNMFLMIIQDIQHRKNNIDNDKFVGEFKRFSNTLLRVSLIFSALINKNETCEIEIEDNSLTKNEKLGKIDNASFGAKVEVLRKTLQNNQYFELFENMETVDMNKLSLLSKKNGDIQFNINKMLKDTSYDNSFNPIKDKEYSEYVEKELYPSKISQALEFSKQIFSTNLPIKITKYANTMIFFNYIANTRNKAIEHATIEIDNEIFYEIVIFSYESLLLQLRFIEKTIDKNVQYAHATNYLKCTQENAHKSIKGIGSFKELKDNLDRRVKIDKNKKEDTD